MGKHKIWLVSAAEGSTTGSEHETVMAANVTSVDLQCSDTAAGRLALTVLCFCYALVSVPLSARVLHVGVSSCAAVSHSDFFTYTMAAVELLAVSGFVLTYCGSFSRLPDASSAGVLIVSFIWPGQTLFPVLTCVDRYLAVVHPITYRALGRAAGVWIRNLSAALVWLDCCLWLVLLVVVDVASYYRRLLAALVLLASLAVMTFCSLSVLRVLIGSRPGGARGRRVGPARPKQRAVHIVLLVMAVLWFKFGGNVVVIVSRFSPLLSVRCVGDASTFLFFLPSAVVLPLLRLNRAGKLARGSA